MSKWLLLDCLHWCSMTLDLNIANQAAGIQCHCQAGYCNMIKPQHEN